MIKYKDDFKKNSYLIYNNVKSYRTLYIAEQCYILIFIK